MGNSRESGSKRGVRGNSSSAAESAPFPTLRRALAHYDIGMGFSNATADKFVRRMLTEPGVLERARTELRAAEERPNTRWSSLISNEEYEIDDPMPEEQAKELVVKLLWDKLYPDLPAGQGKGEYRG